jgi:hypothetical protein
MMLVGTAIAVNWYPDTNPLSSLRWHHQLLHLDMYDLQLSSTPKSSHSSFTTEDARRQKVCRQREAFAFRRRCRRNTLSRQR